MRVKRGWAAGLLLLLPGVAWTQERDEPSVPPKQQEAPAARLPEEAPPDSETDTASPVAMSAPRKWHYLTRLEATTWTLLPRAGAGRDEGFMQVEPTLIIDGGAEFGVNVGAPVRLHLWGGGEGASVVRREDWDSLSDWGQLVRGLKLGSGSSPLAVWFGGLEDYTLLSGHLVRRKEHRSWFEERGFNGDMDIDKFCVRLERAHHEAIHGGGDWRLGRTWPGEWNRMIMEELRRAEVRTGEMLTRTEILKIVAARMKVYKIPMSLTSWRGQ